ncbi:valine--tRNA ligase [bacterium]|nr:valine--tRNA ligase [bacterium]
MEKVYNPKTVENKIYQLWEKSGFLKANLKSKKKPFCIIMPPPNANGPLHIGSAVFVTLQDIMIRYQRMKGKEVLWLPGVDHAGFETQVVFEKELEKKGETRFQYSPKKLCQMIWRFCQRHRKVIENQLKRLGASCDWSREKFTLDKDIVKIVYETFKKLYDDGLVYRGERIINWCPHHETSLSDLEVKHKNIKGKLWFIRYPLKTTNYKPQPTNYIKVATTRPETMLGDTAVAVNPKDKRYKNLVGEKVILPLVGREIPIITDKRVDMEFGTGAVKVTPAHDPLDFEIARDHKLPAIQIIGKDGKMRKEAGKDYAGLKALECRKKILEDLRKKGFLEKEEDYKYSIAVCYKCQTPIEPLISKQWFIKIIPLAKKATKVVKEGEIKFIPAHYKKIYLHWMKNIRDWNISRQIVWGIQMPIWQCQNKNSKIKNKKSKIKDSYFVSFKKPKKCPICQKCKPKQIEDTFDTWFSSGQWPFATLLASGHLKSKIKNKKSKIIFNFTTDDFEYFYPTSVMETGWDILFFWVARMIMLGIYATGKIPFRYVFLHGLVRDKDRQKMSKSKGNVIDPLGVVELYGADALRMALVFGTGPGKDIMISEEKILGQRNFTNKIWNATRFILQQISKSKIKIKNKKLDEKTLTRADKKILRELNKTIKSVTKDVESFRFGQAAQTLYHFFWHDFCDRYIEESKKQLQTSNIKHQTSNILLYVLLTSMKLLHPFMPFITEEIYQRLPLKNKKKCLMIEEWPI